MLATDEATIMFLSGEGYGTVMSIICSFLVNLYLLNSEDFGNLKEQRWKHHKIMSTLIVKI